MQLSSGQNFRQLKYTLALPAMGIPFLSEIEEHLHRPCGRHSHREVQVLAVLHGSMRTLADDHGVVCRAGQACVIPPRLSHWVAAGGSDPRVVYLDVRFAESSGPLHGFLRPGAALAVRTAEQRPLAETARALAVAARSGGAGQPARVMAALWQLSAQLSDASAGELAAGDAPDLDRRLLAAERYMKDRLSREITVHDLATVSGLSRSQLSRLYAKSFNQSPAARLRQLRVEQAEHLLAHSTLSVKEVARVCGFVCANHFSRVFHDLTGKTPRNRAGRSN